MHPQITVDTARGLSQLDVLDREVAQIIGVPMGTFGNGVLAGVGVHATHQGRSVRAALDGISTSPRTHIFWACTSAMDA